MNLASRIRRVLVSTRFWFGCYVALLVCIVVGFWNFKQWAAQTYDNPVAQQQWEKWKSDVRQQSGSSPVQRREPKSSAPPATVLLSDHFGVCLAIALVLSSVLFGVFMFMVRGALMQTEDG